MTRYAGDKPRVMPDQNMPTDALLLLALATFLLAGTIKGLVGIGLPTASVGILAQFTDPRHVIALLLLPALVTNAWQVYRSNILKKSVAELWPFASALMVTIWIFALLAAKVPTDLLVLGIGCVIVLFVLTNLFSEPFHIPRHLDRPVQVLAGAIAGAMGGLTSIWAPPMVIYFLARRLPKDEFVGASGLLILAGTVPLIAGYWQAGLMTPTLAGMSALMILPTLLGFAIGEKLRAFFSAEQFRYLVLVVFLLMGLNLVKRVLM